MKVNYALIAMSRADNEILHACCYEHLPTDKDEQHLIAELKTDEEFELTHHTVNVDYEIILCSEENGRLPLVKRFYPIPDEF
jgi:hypothetical protein